MEGLATVLSSVRPQSGQHRSPAHSTTRLHTDTHDVQTVMIRKQLFVATVTSTSQIQTHSVSVVQ